MWGILGAAAFVTPTCLPFLFWPYWRKEKDGRTREDAGASASVCGLGREEAEKRLVDSDLWILHPADRYALEGEEGVRKWKTAAASMKTWRAGSPTTTWRMKPSSKHLRMLLTGLENS